MSVKDLNRENGNIQTFMSTVPVAAHVSDDARRERFRWKTEKNICRATSFWKRQRKSMHPGTDAENARQKCRVRAEYREKEDKRKTEVFEPDGFQQLNAIRLLLFRNCLRNDRRIFSRPWYALGKKTRQKKRGKQYESFDYDGLVLPGY